MVSLQRFSVVFLSVALVLMGAQSILAHPAVQTTDLGSLSDADLKTVIIRLERTHCFGTCPAYAVTIHGDGRVEFIDKEKAGLKSSQESTVDRNAVMALLSEFGRAKFLSLPDYLLEK